MDLLFPQTVINDLGVPQVIDWRNQLPVNPNYTWAQLAGIRPLEDLSTIGLHHDAISKAQSANYSDLELATNIAKYHISMTKNEKKGDAGFPYHIWIRNGNTYYCNNILDLTYGIARENGYIVHICVSGDYVNGDQLTDADRNALLAAILAVKGLLPSYSGIKAHCELNPTSCPGYDYRSIRNDVNVVELRIKAASDPSKTKERAYVGANQHNYLYSEYAKDPAKNKWLEPWLLDLEQFMRDKGMFFDK